MKSNTNLHWETDNNLKIIFLYTCTILHPCAYVSIIIDVTDIPRSVCNNNQVLG